MVPTFPCCELFLPLAAPLDAELLAILIPIPDQQFTARPDGPACPVEDLPVVLKGHQILLLIVPGTVHIPEVTQSQGKQTMGDVFRCPLRSVPAPTDIQGPPTLSLSLLPPLFLRERSVHSPVPFTIYVNSHLSTLLILPRMVFSLSPIPDSHKTVISSILTL